MALRPTIDADEPAAGTVPTMWTAPSFSMPDTTKLRKVSGQPGGQRLGCGFPVAHMLALFHAGTGFIVKVLTAPLRATRYGSSGPAPPGACRRRYFDWRPRGQFIFSFGVIDAQAFARTVSEHIKSRSSTLSHIGITTSPANGGRKASSTLALAQASRKTRSIGRVLQAENSTRMDAFEEEYNSLPRRWSCASCVTRFHVVLFAPRK